jgi:hypothetical protein
MELKHRAELHKIIDLSLPAAEVGCAECFYANDILSWGVAKLYLVDAWAHLEQAGDGANSDSWHQSNYIACKQRLEKYGDKAVFLRGKSVDMAVRIPDNSLGFVNIDCDHSYQGVWNDIQAYWPKLVSGGVMAFHDYEMPHYGVKKAVQAFAMGKYEIHLLPENKLEDAGAYIIKP